MICIPEQSEHHYRLLSIDPGTNTLGIAVWELDLITGNRLVVFSHTVRTDHLIKGYAGMGEVHGDRACKLLAIENAVYYFLSEWRIHGVASESPYLRRLARPFAALTECVMAIRRAVYRYNSLIALDLIDPATVKMSVGVPGNSGDKNLMRVAVTTLFASDFTNNIDPQCIDEHAIDAIAVGHAFLESCFGSQRKP